MQDNRTTETMSRDMPLPVNMRNTTHVKAFDGVDKVVTYECAPCPICGKWIVANPAHHYCEYCGQRLSWENVE